MNVSRLGRQTMGTDPDGAQVLNRRLPGLKIGVLAFSMIVGNALAAGNQIGDGAIVQDGESEQRLQQVPDEQVPDEQVAQEVLEASEDPGAAVEVAALESPVYIPPFRGAPKTRVGGGTRSAGANVELALLAPEHTGRTAQASPTLYWWISGAHSGEFEFVIMNRDAIEPDLRVRRQLTLAAGIHAFDLGSEDFALQPGVSYQWSVALIRDPDRRSRDIVGLATLEYDAASGDSADAGILGGLAERGLFYDAFAALEAPAPRADLLEQVALMDVARWIREAD